MGRAIVIADAIEIVCGFSGFGNETIGPPIFQNDQLIIVNH